MTSESSIDLIEILVPDVITEVEVSENGFEFSCVWYRTIKMTGSIIHQQLEIGCDYMGVWSSAAPYLSPRLFPTIEDFLIEHASIQIRSFNEYCLNLLPDKYLAFYHSKFKFEKVGLVDKNATFDTLLKLKFGAYVTGIRVSNNIISFVLYETVCFELHTEENLTVLKRVGRSGSAITLFTTNNEDWEKEILGFVKSYAFCIIPDEWFNKYMGSVLLENHGI
ncbi:MAG TPA: hypothetical protein PLR80_00335 [Saccharofermentans sp.]|jgi:hypothetical protein|nr:hypothetical protein [Saccharofermentans sp.]